MATLDPLSWAFHDDFAEKLVQLDARAALRLLQTADIGLTFARTLVARNFADAAAMLSPECREACPPHLLQFNLERMIGYDENETRWPTDVQVVTGIEASELRNARQSQPTDFGWVYVAIDGVDFCEAVSVTVCESHGRLVIRNIEWGRP